MIEYGYIFDIRPPFGGQGLRELVPSGRPTKGTQSKAIQYRA